MKYLTTWLAMVAGLALIVAFIALGRPHCGPETGAIRIGGWLVAGCNGGLR